MRKNTSGGTGWIVGGEKQLPLLFERYGKVLSCKKGQSVYIQDYEAEAFYMVEHQHAGLFSSCCGGGHGTTTVIENLRR